MSKDHPAEDESALHAHANGEASAYPVSHREEVHEFEGHKVITHEGYQGLTKRELFAAMAMQGLLANPRGSEVKRDIVVSEAVFVADALLKELAK